MTVLLWARLIFPVILFALVATVRVDGLPLGEQEVSGAMAMVTRAESSGRHRSRAAARGQRRPVPLRPARRLFMVVDGVGGQAAGGARLPIPR